MEPIIMLAAGMVRHAMDPMGMAAIAVSCFLGYCCRPWWQGALAALAIGIVVLSFVSMRRSELGLGPPNFVFVIIIYAIFGVAGHWAGRWINRISKNKSEV